VSFTPRSLRPLSAYKQTPPTLLPIHNQIPAPFHTHSSSLMRTRTMHFNPLIINHAYQPTKTMPLHSYPLSRNKPDRPTSPKTPAISTSPLHSTHRPCPELNNNKISGRHRHRQALRSNHHPKWPANQAKTKYKRPSCMLNPPAKANRTQNKWNRRLLFGVRFRSFPNANSHKHKRIRHFRNLSVSYMRTIYRATSFVPCRACNNPTITKYGKNSCVRKVWRTLSGLTFVVFFFHR
jgi:hypothetical protein